MNEYLKKLESALKLSNYDLAKQIITDMEKDFPPEKVKQN